MVSERVIEVAADREARHALAAVEAGEHDVVLLVASGRVKPDRRLSDLVTRLAAAQVAVVVAGVTGQDAVHALLAAGACDVIEAVRRGPQYDRVVSRALGLAAALKQEARFDSGVPLSRQLGSGETMLDRIRLMEKAAATLSPILMVGESGTGKLIVARAIHGHEKGVRGSGPFIRCLLKAIEPAHFDEELYGTARRPGVFGLAHGGTLYLEDVALLPPVDQARLLQVLSDGPKARVTCADGSQTAPADLRLIAATTADLPEEVARGRFRQDLYYRLKVMPIVLPPLRRRPSDIPGLAIAMIDRWAARLGKTIVGLSPGALALLQGCDWPGNLSELEQRLAAAVRHARGPVLEEEDLEPMSEGNRIRGAAGAVEIVICLDETLPLAEMSRRGRAAAEIAAIRHALEASGGNVARAARALRTGRAHLQRRIRMYGLKRKGE